MFSEDRRNLLLEKMPHQVQSRLAYNDLPEQGKIFWQNLESLSESKHIKIEEIDKHLFEGFLSYANRLYTTDTISESAYIALITRITESYAERLVELTLAKAMKKYEFYFEKAILHWLS